MKSKYKRLSIALLITTLLGGALTLTLCALNESMMYFMTPEELLIQKEKFLNQQIRLGGLVKEDSLKALSEPMTIEFIVTDTHQELKIIYKGILPDLFREGQGVIAIGKLINDHQFHASQILAKHDETYMPKEIAEALKKKDLWKEK